MLELILLVLVFLNSRLAEYAVLAVIVIYGMWGIYMKTYQPDVWLKIQEAEDRRRANAFAALTTLGRTISHRLAKWLSAG